MCVSIIGRDEQHVDFQICYIYGFSSQEPLQVRFGATMTPKNGVFLRIASH